MIMGNMIKTKYKIIFYFMVTMASIFIIYMDKKVLEGTLLIYSCITIGFLLFRNKPYKPDSPSKKNILFFIILTNIAVWIVKIYLLKTGQ